MLRVVVTAAFWMAMLCPVPLRAQHPAKIAGTVVDATGAVIPNAEVILKQAGQVDRKTLADNFGAFAFSVQPGEYALEVSSSGFETSTLNSITIDGI